MSHYRERRISLTPEEINLVQSTCNTQIVRPIEWLEFVAGGYLRPLITDCPFGYINDRLRVEEEPEILLVITSVQANSKDWVINVYNMR
jgi:hypothetical protein